MRVLVVEDDAGIASGGRPRTEQIVRIAPARSLRVLSIRGASLSSRSRTSASVRFAGARPAGFWERVEGTGVVGMGQGWSEVSSWEYYITVHGMYNH